MIHRIEKLFDIKLEHPTRTAIIPTRLPNKCFESPHRRVRSFTDSARIAVENKRTIEQRKKDAIHRMVHQTVANRCLVNDPLFRIADQESVIRSMMVSSRSQFVLQQKDVVFEMALKKSDIFSFSLAGTERSPCGKKIFGIDNSLKYAAHT